MRYRLIDAPVGANIDTTVLLMRRFAERAQVRMLTVFNGVAVVVSPGDDPRKVIKCYSAEIEAARYDRPVLDVMRNRAGIIRKEPQIWNKLCLRCKLRVKQMMEGRGSITGFFEALHHHHDVISEFQPLSRLGKQQAAAGV